MNAAALLVRCNAHVAQTLLSLAAAVIHYNRFCGYRQSRPQVGSTKTLRCFLITAKRQ